MTCADEEFYEERQARGVTFIQRKDVGTARNLRGPAVSYVVEELLDELRPIGRATLLVDFQ